VRAGGRAGSARAWPNSDAVAAAPASTTPAATSHTAIDCQRRGLAPECIASWMSSATGPEPEQPSPREITSAARNQETSW